MRMMPGAWRRVGFAAVCRGMFASVGTATLVATIATVVPQVARAESNSIQSVTSTRQGDATYLRITMEKPPANPPAGFTIANPPRIALDFADTTNESGRNSYELSQGDVRKVNIVTAANRSRLVLSLKRPVGYKTEIDGRDVVVTLEPLPTAADTAVKPASYTFARPEPRIGQVVHALRDIDFRRGENGAGRVIVELSDSNIGVDIRQQGQAIIVDFQNAQLPDNLVRRLDVGDFGTPVRVVRSMQRPDGSRLVIEPSGLWEHNAYQSDNQFVLELKRVVEDPNKLVQGSRGKYQGEKLSLNFQNIDVRSVLQVIADFTDFNIITSDSVQGNLTLRLKDVPWDQALDIILQAKGLDMRKNGNVIWIAPQSEIAAYEKAREDARAELEDRVEIVHRVTELVEHEVGGTGELAVGVERVLLEEAADLVAGLEEVGVGCVALLFGGGEDRCGLRIRNVRLRDLERAGPQLDTGLVGDESRQDEVAVIFE